MMLTLKSLRRTDLTEKGIYKKHLSRYNHHMFGLVRTLNLQDNQ